MFDNHNKLKMVVASVPFAICIIVGFVGGLLGWLAGESADRLHDWTLKQNENR